MKRRLMIGLLFFVAVAVLSGCVTDALYLGKTLDIQNENEIIQVPIDQPQVVLASIPMIDYSKAEEIAFECPEKLLEKEYRLFRISWPLIGISDAGDIYWGISFINQKQKSPAGKLYCHGKIFIPKREGYNLIILSTRATMGYDMSENEFAVDRDMLKKDREYKKGIFHKGTPVSQIGNPGVFDEIVGKWNRFKTPFGNVRTPNDRKIIEALSVQYTGFTVADRKNRDSKDVLSVYPFGTIIAKGNDIYRMLWGKTSGWDMGSDDNNSKITKADLDGLKRDARVVRY